MVERRINGEGSENDWIVTENDTFNILFFRKVSGDDVVKREFSGKNFVNDSEGEMNWYEISFTLYFLEKRNENMA